MSAALPVALLRAHGLRVNESEYLISRETFAALAGLTFDGVRDLYRALGYTRTLAFRHYQHRFERGGIAKRIVHAYPDATWGTPPSVIESDDPPQQLREHAPDTDFERAFVEIAMRTNLWAQMLRADLLNNIGRFSILVVGVRDGIEASSPIGKVKGPDDVLYLQPFSEGSARVVEIEEDPQSERFGLPKLYEITRRVGRKNVKANVHASRVVHLAEGALEDELCGTPRLKAPWNYLDDLEKLSGSSAEAFWNVANRGLHVNLPAGTASADVTGRPEDDTGQAKVDAIKSQVNEWHHGQRRVIGTENIEISALASSEVNPEGVFKVLLPLIAGTTGIPQRILVGSEVGSLASEQDRENWNERIEERQKLFATPIVLALVDVFEACGAVPKPAKQVRAVWPTGTAMTETQRASVAQQRASAALSIVAQENIAKQAGIEPAITVREYRQAEGLPREPAAEDKTQSTRAARDPKPAPDPEEEPDTEAPRANAHEFDQLAEAVGRRSKAEEWRDEIEAWALAELAIEAAEILAAIDGAVEAPRANALRANDEPLTEAQRKQIETALEGLREMRAERIARSSRRTLRSVIEGAASSAAVELDLETDFAATRKAVREFVDGYTFTFAKKVSDESEAIVRTLVDQAVEQRQTLAETRTAILDRFTGDVNRAQLIARTETIRASNAGAVETYRQAGITEKRWITAGDACEFCAQFEGKVVGIDETFAEKGDALTVGDRTMSLDYEAVAQPPLHPNCRCATVAVVL